MGLLDRILKLARETRHYPCLRHKLLSFYNLLLISRKLNWVPFFGRRWPVSVVVMGHSHPFAVRLGSTDWLVLVEIFLDGEYAEVARLFSDSHPETIIDLGANVGFSVRYWLEMFPKSRIIAVEPETENCTMIKRNIALCCPTKSPEVVQACIVGQSRDSVLFETASGREWAYAITNAASPTAVKVRATTMENLIAEYAINRPIELLKCDIEGGEADLFENCESWIHRVRSGVVEVHGDFTVAKLLTLLGKKCAVVAVHASRKSDICTFQVLNSQNGSQ